MRWKCSGGTRASCARVEDEWEEWRDEGVGVEERRDKADME